MSVLQRLAQVVRASRDNGDGFPAYLMNARKAGVDVNDWIESNLGWMPARPILESLVFPYLRENSIVCEVGVGTGRWSRHLAERIPEGRLILVDQSRWVTSFLRDYFKSNHRVTVLEGDGLTLPLDTAGWADVIFSQGLFITLKLGHVRQYLECFFAALKPGGVAIFDFIDPDTPGGWEFLGAQYRISPTTFSYHTLGAIVACATAAGFSVEWTSIAGKSTYVAVRKARPGTHENFGRPSKRSAERLVPATR
jgi:SAM-dependent methyltransferase